MLWIVKWQLKPNCDLNCEIYYGTEIEDHSQLIANKL